MAMCELRTFFKGKREDTDNLDSLEESQVLVLILSWKWPQVFGRHCARALPTPWWLLWLSGVRTQGCLYFLCHSGLVTATMGQVWLQHRVVNTSNDTRTRARGDQLSKCHQCHTAHAQFLLCFRADTHNANFSAFTNVETPLLGPLVVIKSISRGW